MIIGRIWQALQFGASIASFGMQPTRIKGRPPYWHSNINTHDSGPLRTFGVNFL